MAKKGARKYVIFFYKEEPKVQGEKSKTIILRESLLNTKNGDVKEKKLKMYSPRSKKYEMCSCKIKEK